MSASLQFEAYRKWGQQNSRVNSGWYKFSAQGLVNIQIHDHTYRKVKPWNRSNLNRKEQQPMYCSVWTLALFLVASMLLAEIVYLKTDITWLRHQHVIRSGEPPAFFRNPYHRHPGPLLQIMHIVHVEAEGLEHHHSADVTVAGIPFLRRTTTLIPTGFMKPDQTRGHHDLHSTHTWIKFWTLLNQSWVRCAGSRGVVTHPSAEVTPQYPFLWSLSQCCKYGSTHWVMQSA